MSYSWPGNIRELQNAILAAAVDAPRNIGTAHLRQHLSGKAELPKEKGTPLPERIISVLENSVRMTLAQMHADLQVPKPTLHRHLVRMVSDRKIQRIEIAGSVLYVLHGKISDGMNDSFTSRQEQTVTMAREEGRITRQRLADALGVSIRTASRELAALVTQNVLVRDNQRGKLSGYRVLT